MLPSANNTTPLETQGRVITSRAMRKGKKKVEKNFNSLERLQVVYLPITALIPNTWNPNRQSDHDFELLLKSMEEDGFDQPVLALQQREDGKHIIIDGEHRWRGAQALGLKEIPAVLVDMTPEQARISTIRHNRARGSHDIQLEAEILRDLQKLGAIEIAQDSLLLDDIELNRLLNDISTPDLMADDEFNEAWLPDHLQQGEIDAAREGFESARSNVSPDGRTMSAMTVAAVEAQHKVEEMLKEARTEQDRRKAHVEHAIFRLSLIFSGEQAKIVRAVFADVSPAEAVFEYCKAIYEQRKLGA